MSRFLGLALQTDVLCASGARRAFWPAAALVACQATLSPTEPESLVATVPRTDARAAEVVEGRVLRTCFATVAEDREWEIVGIDDTDTDDALTVTAQPIGLRMARKLYEAADAATGAPIFDFTAVDITAAEALDLFVLPTLAARGMSWVAAGTIDQTVRFDVAGEYASALEIVRAICEPGRAGAEWQLRRDGDAGYLLDLRTAIGSDAGTLRVRTGTNLLAHRRARNTLDAVTRVIPRGATGPIDRSMSAHLWRVKTVVSSTVLELEDILGGDGPIAFDDQLNGKNLAVLNSATFATVGITDSVAGTHRVVCDAAHGASAGQWVRVFEGDTANGARLTSLASPVAVALPSAGGLGDVAEFLDRPAVRAECNLVPNPYMRTWSSPSSAPDGWTVTAGTPANLTQSRETTTIRESPYTLRLVTTGSTTLAVETPDIPVWAIAGRRHFPAIWFYVDAVPAAATSAIVVDLITSSGTKIAEIGRWVRTASDLDTWLRVEGAVLDLSAVSTAVRIRVSITTTTGGAAESGWDVLVSNALLAESEILVEDIEYSGGTVLWQEANRRLLEASAAIRGNEIALADLEADDPTVFASLAIVPGQSVELTDLTLGEQSTQRLLEAKVDYLVPLATTIRVGPPAASAVRALVPRGAAAAGDADASTASQMVALETAFDEDGALYVRVIGDADTGSIYCAVSTSGEPTEATLMQATPVVGRQAEFSFTGPYTLGQTVYIAARGAARVGGAGALSDVIRARAVRSNSATSKTIRLSGVSAVLSAANADTYDRTLPYYAFDGGSEGLAAFLVLLPVPKGATLTGWRMRVFADDNNGDPSDVGHLQAVLQRLGESGTATDIGSYASTTTEGAWETIGQSALSEDTAGNRSYCIRGETLGIGAAPGADVFDYRVAWIEYDLDVPNLDVTT